MQTKHYSTLIIIILFFTTFSCSTKKNTLVSRTYHNINAHYNVYFNGNEALNGGVEKIKNNYIDNYTEILSIYQFGDKASASSASGDMEIVLKKAAKLIKRHSIKKKPKRKKGKKRMSEKDKAFYSKGEFNKWVDDAYMLTGKAHFYKLEFTQAIRIFEYIIQNYSDKELHLKAQYWIARSYNEMKDYRNAKISLDMLKGMGVTPKKMKKEISLVIADHYLKQHDYKGAIPKLKIAIRETKKKRERGRYTFILAQIYQNEGNKKKATELYAKVSKLDPTYEMQFNASINSAVAFSGNSKGDDIIKKLEKMLKDEKNEDFKDQIYYALANIYMKKDELANAKEYYRLSSASSTSNKNQKAVSCLALADIYFAEPEYSLAQAYYDSTILNLDKDFPGYESIYLKTKNLTALVNNLTTIEYQDSLQLVANMSENDRVKLIDQRIQDYKTEQARQKAAQTQGNTRDPIFDDDVNRVSTSRSSLPFYTQAALSRGVDMFSRKWGSRKLEDNWRRSNKSIVLEMNEDSEDSEIEEDTEVFTEEEREFYLADLPLSDSLMQISTDKIEKAYYNAGEIYMDKLEDSPEAIKIYEQLNSRFPEGKYLLSSYYNLYRMNKELGNSAEAEKYKKLIIREFPNSAHAILFTNPNYLNELKANKQKIDKVYESAYTKYKEKNFSEAINIANEGLVSFPQNYIEPKFVFLIALNKSALAAPDATVLQQELKKVIAKYPQSDEAERASEMLQALNATKGEEFSDATEIYLKKRSSSYFYILILKNSININRVEFDIAKFNINNFSRISFSVSNRDLKKSEKMIVVEGMTKLEDAIEYFEKIKKNNEIRQDLKFEIFEEFIISEENLKEFELDKNAKRYIDFMNKNILK